ncbi:class I SAM-dependent methyltransferase [Vallitalea pronyensis]|uniref:Class I SAM-dependent methyltransferase n=1 Tax=Vallitalea pronyensis TaxID=1348613 RepID=A0A8J8SF78_9FIRM|nr:class I SAM-dependent methyltransferase [Vallitalea pronyensis]QUI21311.1 class I SAM-dependent methyltransferase [Vallitalea pronyensis]
MDLYETSALFNQNMSQQQQHKLMNFYKQVFKDYPIKTIHDCSIGAGGTTLPLAKLGYNLSGSDLSESLLNKAKENFKAAGYDIELYVSDFRTLHRVLPFTYDCIMSTGNSLPHINNDDIRNFVKSISCKINKNGLFFIDLRNWDKLLKERPIFNARDPLVMSEKQHTSLYQIWNWHDDQSVDFIFATSTDKNGQHESISFTQAPPYYPLRYKDYKKILNDHHFEIKACFDVDYLWMSAKKQNNSVPKDFEKDFWQINWYAILAQKVA